MSIRTLIPTSEVDTWVEALAPRPESLDGAVIGLYANVKINGDKFLDALAALIEVQHPTAQFIRRTEGEIGMGSDGPYDELAAKCHLVITGVGD
jgi:hypothetical protein